MFKVKESNYILNSGSFHDFPSQSEYATMHQFRLSNMCLLFPNVRRNGWAYGGNQFNSIHSLIKQLEKSRSIDHSYNREMFRTRKNIRFSATYRPKKHCPECAQVGFHHTMFDLPYITDCPIHLKKLVTKCPVCEQKWPNFNELMIRKCKGCTLSDVKLRIRATFKLIDNKKSFIKLLAIESFLNDATTKIEWLNEKTNRAPSIEITTKPDIYHEHFATVNYPIYLYKTGDPKNIKPLLQVLPLRSRTYKLKSMRNRQESSESIFPLNVNDLNKKILIELCNFIDNNTSKHHRIKLEECREHSLYIFQKPKFCPFCLAFSYWFALTQNTLEIKESYYFVPPKSEIAKKYKFLSFIEPRFFNKENKIYQIDNDMNEWLYIKNSKALFFFLFHRFYVVSFLSDELYGTKSLYDLISLKTLKVFFIEQLFGMKIDEESNTITVTAWPENSEMMLEKIKIFYFQQNCDSSRSFLPPEQDSVNTNLSNNLHPTLFLSKEQLELFDMR